jgi:N4-gp56 family major capsid protein
MANGPVRYNNNDGTYASYASDSTSKFIPIVWSRKMLRNFYQTTAFMEIANTDYQGEIKSQGDKVMIRHTPVITINAHEVGKTLTYQVPEIANTALNIDKAMNWAFQLDDIDDVQSDLDLMNKFAADAGERLKIAIDAECFTYLIDTPTATTNRGNTAGAISANIPMGAATAWVQVDHENSTDVIVDVNTVLDERNQPNENRFLVIPAWFAASIKKGDLKSADISGDATGVIRSGVIGMVDRTKLIQSNNLPSVTDTGTKVFYCFGGTKEATTFALQLTKTESLRIPTSFGTYMRGLAVYGRQVVQPTALVQLYAAKKA